VYFCPDALREHRAVFSLSPDAQLTAFFVIADAAVNSRPFGRHVADRNRVRVIVQCVVARALGLPLAGTLRPEPTVCQALERGEAPTADGRGPLAELCRRLVRELTADHRDEGAA
jgi:hypothetical protein